MSEGQASQERPITRELLGKENVTTQAQLLGVVTAQGEPIQDKIDRVATQGIEGIDQNLQDTYSEASFTQRKRYQKQKEDGNQPHTKELWAEELNGWLGKIRDDHDQPDRAAFLKDIGLGEDSNATQFYEKYLKGNSNIIQFINDIEAHATREQIIAHADIIRGLGNTFGYESSEAIEHLIHGVRNIKDDKAGFMSAIGGEITISPLLKKLVEDSSEERAATPPPARTEDRPHHDRTQPPARTEGTETPPPTRELTEEFARTDPEGFKVALLAHLQQTTTHLSTAA